MSDAGVGIGEAQPSTMMDVRIATYDTSYVANGVLFELFR